MAEELNKKPSFFFGFLGLLAVAGAVAVVGAMSGCGDDGTSGATHIDAVVASI